MARGQGEGTISKLKNGTWCGRLTVGYDENGKQKRKAFYGKTKNEVQKKMDETKVELAKGTYNESSSMTVAEWMEVWLLEYKKRSLKKSSYLNVRQRVTDYIIPQFSRLQLRNLTPEAVQRFVNRLVDRGLSARTVNDIYGDLSRGLKQAINNGLITRDVCGNIELPEIPPKKETRVLTPDEQKRFIESAKEDYYGDLFILLMSTGLRIGEGAALQWKDVNFEDGTLTVSKTLSSVRDYDDPNDKWHNEVSSPKTKSSNRVVPLMPNVLNMLKEKKKDSAADELIFKSVKGESVRFGSARHHFNEILKAAGIEKQGLHPHCLRHGFATRAFEAGIDIRIVQELLGHATLNMTASIYTHVFHDKKKEAVKLLEDML